jgi:hypothetical protein
MVTLTYLPSSFTVGCLHDVRIGDRVIAEHTTRIYSGVVVARVKDSEGQPRYAVRFDGDQGVSQPCTIIRSLEGLLDRRLDG